MNIQNSSYDTLHVSDKMNIRNLSNRELYALCKEYGKNVRKWSREFGFLLPEVSSRKMYRKYRCASIFEFAAKLAGMSREVVSRILHLSDKLHDKPLIWNGFKRYGWAKLKIIAGTVTAESQEFWLDKINRLPKAALVEYIKEYKKSSIVSVPGQNYQSLFDHGANGKAEVTDNGLGEPENSGALKFGTEITEENFSKMDTESQATDISREPDSCAYATRLYSKLKFRVDSETEFEFKKFKQTMEKEKKEVLTMGETLKLLLKKVGEIENTKSDGMVRPFDKLMAGLAHHDNQDSSISPSRLHHNQKYTQHRRHEASRIKFIATSVRDRALNQVANKSRPVPRKAPQKIQKSIIAAYNGMCAFSGCNEPYSELHHPDRFSLKKSHQRIYPLCRLHHQLAHAGLIKNEELTIENWEVDFEKKGHYQKVEKQRVDQMVRDHWNA